MAIIAGPRYAPGQLFLQGEQGIWLDPSDINLAWRRNWVTSSENFSVAAWNFQAEGLTVTLNAALAPDGTLTANKLAETATTTLHCRGFSLSTSAGYERRFSFYAKAAERTFARAWSWAGGDTTQQTFDLVNGTCTGSQNPKITSVGNGWYRCEFNIPAANSSTVVFGPSDGVQQGTGPYAGIEGSGIYAWGAQLEYGYTTTDYQRITDAVSDYFTYSSTLPVMYQDTTGTTPVTAAEQPVGLMLDKSKTLTSGANLVSSYICQGGAYGNLNGMTLSGTTLTTNNNPANAYSTRISVTAGKIYLVKFPARLIPSGGNWYIGVWWSANGTSYSGNVRTSPISSTSFIFVAPATATSCEVGVTRDVASTTGAADTCGPFTGFTVQEVPGNHASQSTTASRPVLSSRVNLLERTQEFDNAYWSKSNGTVISNAATAPDGTLTADSLLWTASINPQVMSPTINIAAGTSFTFSCSLKAGTKSVASIIPFSDGSNYVEASFNLATGVAATPAVTGTRFTAVVAAMSPQGSDGWYRCTLTFATNTLTSFGVRVRSNTATQANDNILLWGADLRAANESASLPAYQRVTTATDYDIQGFLPYLKFDGVDDCLFTASIDFSTNTTVYTFFGTRRLSDANWAVLFELSPNFNSVETGFLVTSPEPAGAASTNAALKGGGYSTANYSDTAAPTTGIFTIGFDKSLLTNEISPFRKNGADMSVTRTYNTNNSGTFGNHVFYIGARNNSTYRYNGRLYSLIVRGATTNQTQIAITEAWVAKKTGVIL